MTPKERAIVTEPVALRAGTMLALDLWDAGDAASLATALGFPLPAAGQAAVCDAGTVLRVGPRRWWLDGAGFDAATIAATLADRGVITANGGGWVRTTLTGPDWRDQLASGVLVDTDSAALTPGQVAVTLLFHARAVVHVRADNLCDVYVPASYAEHCLGHWHDAAA
jgi:heterotetrameric sarcosine oxidase gamma subunit